jgi:hypothetical protein
LTSVFDFFYGSINALTNTFCLSFFQFFFEMLIFLAVFARPFSIHFFWIKKNGATSLLILKGRCKITAGGWGKSLLRFLLASARASKPTSGFKSLAYGAKNSGGFLF